jgi:hypothetical protein
MSQHVQTSVRSQSLWARSWFSSLAIAAFSLLSLISIISLQIPRARAITESALDKETYQRQEDIMRFNVNFLKTMPALGFNNLVSDWVMLRFIQYLGDRNARKETGYSVAPEYLEAIVEQDPRFVRAYLIISPVSSMHAGRPERTVALMNKGLESLSPDIDDSYFVWLYKGIDELLFLGDTEAAKNSYEMTAEWAKIAGNEHIAQMATGTAKFLADNPDSRQAQVNAWGMVLSYAPDDNTRKIAIENIERLGGRVEFTDDNRFRIVNPE